MDRENNDEEQVLDQLVAEQPFSKVEETLQNEIDFIYNIMDDLVADANFCVKTVQDAVQNVGKTHFKKAIAQDAIATLDVVTSFVSTANAMRSKLRTLVKRALQFDNASSNSVITYSETRLEDLENCIKHSEYRARFYTSLAAALVNIEFDDNITIIPYWYMSGFIVDQTDCSRATFYSVYMQIADKLYFGRFSGLDFGPFGAGVVCKLSKRYLVEAKKQKKPVICFDNVPYASFDDTHNITMKVKFVKFGDNDKLTFICVIHDADTKKVLVNTHIALCELDNMQVKNATEYPLIVKSFEITQQDLEFTCVDTSDPGEEIAYLKSGGIGQF